jgi:hypothetical protein
MSTYFEGFAFTLTWPIFAVALLIGVVLASIRDIIERRKR